MVAPRAIRRAAIDIGTNTMLLLVADVERAEGGSSPPWRIVRVLDDRIDFVRLGEGVHNRRAFSPEAMERSRQCFLKYKKICDDLGVTEIVAAATSASRDSSNSREFYDRIREETGIDVRVIAGKTEARLSFLGGLHPEQDPARFALLDIGGGSTEFVALNPDGKDVHGQSLDMGCVRATEMFLRGDPYDPESMADMEVELRNRWSAIDGAVQKELRAKDWVAIAGTPTTLAALRLGLRAFDPNKVDGYVLDLPVIKGMYLELARQLQSEREAISVVGRGRADIIVSGTAILFTAMEHFGKEEVVVSARGLRHGVMIDPPRDYSGSTTPPLR